MHRGKSLYAVCLAVLVTAWSIGAVDTPIRLLFLPFEDEVKLGEVWDLAVDVPRWFSVSIDTVVLKDGATQSVDFDSVLSALGSLRWQRDDYLSAKGIVRLAARFGAKYVLSGKVLAFKVVKRSVGGDVDFGASHGLGEQGGGRGGSKVYGGIQSQTAAIRMVVDIYDGSDGRLATQVVLDSEKKEGDLAVWLPFQLEHTALDFYNMRNSPFGSHYFNRCVPGAIMRSFAATTREKILAIDLPGRSGPVVEREYLEGSILDREGNEVFLDLGIKDNLIPGEVLQVLRPARPVISKDGDTLGWVEEPVGRVKVRYLKSDHFSVASVEEELQALMPGWTVRVAPGGTEGVEGGRP